MIAIDDTIRVALSVIGNVVMIGICLYGICGGLLAFLHHPNYRKQQKSPICNNYNPANNTQNGKPQLLSRSPLTDFNVGEKKGGG